ncbi:MAG: HWE histidine kinase domain-containing protein [Acetobacteraceae bacterium]
MNQTVARAADPAGGGGGSVAAAESERRYRALFEAIDQGFCIVEPLSGADGAGDYRILETNPAFERQTGLRNAAGKTARELAEGFDAFWLETFDRIALTGEPARFEHASEASGRRRVFDVHGFRIGEPARHRVAILFREITGQKRTEERLREGRGRQAFLLKLEDALRPIADPIAMQGEAARLLAEELKPSRVYYAEIRDGFYVVEREYPAGTPSVVGRYSLAERPVTSGPLRAGRTVVAADFEAPGAFSERERHGVAALGIRAAIVIPIMKNGELRAVLSVAESAVRHWTAAEIALVEATAQRTWAAVEQARAEARFREAQARELVAMRQLQSISTTLIEEGDIGALYEKIVGAAALLAQADAATMQEFNDATGTLRLAAWYGLNPEAMALRENVSLDRPSLCASVMAARRRVIIDDVEVSDLAENAAEIEYFRKAQIRAVQCTPLVSRSGRLLGLLATHWQEPHTPEEDELGLLDVLARQAADLVVQKRGEEDMRLRTAQLGLMVDELNHRVKNTLATVQAIAAQSLRGAASPEAAAEVLELRLVALAKAHDVLTREHWRGAALRDVLAAATAPNRSRFDIEASDIRLRPPAAVALSMVLHELATNAVKHGALSNDAGRVAIRFSIARDPARFTFEWIESGGPVVRPPRRRGFGARLIERGFAAGAGDKVTYLFAPSGVTFAVEGTVDLISEAVV